MVARHGADRPGQTVLHPLRIGSGTVLSAWLHVALLGLLGIPDDTVCTGALGLRVITGAATSSDSSAAHRCRAVSPRRPRAPLAVHWAILSVALSSLFTLVAGARSSITA